MAKAKRTQRWQRDPEGMRIRILEAAKKEFAAHGIGGARVDRIAAEAGANKRMLYYHVGKKDDLYLAVLEGAYEKIRAEERGLENAKSHALGVPLPFYNSLCLGQIRCSTMTFDRM